MSGHSKALPCSVDVRALRRRLGWTQARLARELGAHRSSVSRWERGRGHPSAENGRKLVALSAGMCRSISAREALRGEILARLNGRHVVASISGGKDSAAMSLYLAELGIPHERIFLDTGWESDLTYEYLSGELARVLGPIKWIAAPRKMEELIRHKGMFPSRVRRFCTTDLKVLPMARYLRTLMDAGADVVNTIGIRAAESEARARMPEWEDSQQTFDCEVWRPILSWSEQDVIAIHKRHGLQPNPLYLLGASRVGCWPCVYARKSELRLLAETDPKRVVRLRLLEEEIGAQATERAAREGRQLTGPPTWFPNRLSTRLANGKRDGSCWPIERVIAWSRSAPRYGMSATADEFLLASQQDGCMRWGLCETSAQDAATAS